MKKKIEGKCWSYADYIELPPALMDDSFLWWTWKVKYIPREYVYKDEAHLLEVVNKFIADNNIIDIISFKNNSGIGGVLNYDSSYLERYGGIQLVYTVEVTDTGK